MLIPRPQRMVHGPGAFQVDSTTAIRGTRGAEEAAALLRTYLQAVTGVPVQMSAEGNIVLSVDPRLVGLGDEGYSLRVSTQAIVLRAGKHAGLLHGVQSIRQLLLAQQGNQIPGLDVTDQPRLPWRGAMLDVARHFLPVSFLCRFVDLLALHKLNVLHLHLTDDQGWRMPIRRYPALTEVGGWRAESMIGPAGSTSFDDRPHGGSYTHAELDSLVRYATRRGVTLVPEIEMPGHARAALAAYPELGNFPDRRHGVWTSWGVSDTVFGVQDATLEFCREVLSDVMSVFPSRRIHIGGDECPTAEWERSPLAQARIEAEGLAGAHQLRGWFLSRISDFLVRHGRQPVCWDDGEHNENLPPEATVMVWRDAGHGLAAAARGHQVVMTPWRSTYLDYPQSASGEPAGQPAGVVTLEDVYHQDLPPSQWEQGARDSVIGTQGQLWTEFVDSPELAEYLAFPRLCALAENAWSGAGLWSDFTDRLAVHQRRLAALNVNFRSATQTYGRT